MVWEKIRLKVFGTKAVVLDKTRKGKFSQKGIEHILVGYSETAKAYRLFNPDTQTIKKPGMLCSLSTI